MGSATTPVYIEAGTKRVFACSLDWPGWCRSGRGEAGALQALAEAAGRYRIIAQGAGIPFPEAPVFEVVERLTGSATTDFGAPDKAAAADTRPVAPDEAGRLAALLRAAWRFFDRVVSESPASLRKGPRGGGRDRDAMVEHVLGAEANYARRIGVRLRQPAARDRDAIAALREAITSAFRAAAEGRSTADQRWPVRYSARRIAWHVLDHAWEMEDRRLRPEGP